jgi:hypothetical protein
VCAVRETDAILQAILYQVKKAKTVDECINAVEVMCNKENLDAVEAKLSSEKEKKNTKGQ